MPGLECGSVMEMSLKEHEKYFDFLPTLPESLKDIDDDVLSPKWVDFKGTHYGQSMVLATGRDDALWWPTFGKVQFILTVNCRPIFVCSRLHNIGFSDHYHGYEVLETNDWFCADADNFSDPLNGVNGVNFVVLRYLI